MDLVIKSVEITLGSQDLQYIIHTSRYWRMYLLSRILSNVFGFAPQTNPGMTAWNLHPSPHGPSLHRQKPTLL